MSQQTRLGLYGGPRPLYGSFAGKAAPEEERGPGSTVLRKRELDKFRDQLDASARKIRILREDEELIAVIAAIADHL